MWAKLMKEQYQPQNSESLLLRAHCQTPGYSLTEYQPSKIMVGNTVEAMADIMGGAQYLHTNLYDKAVGFNILRSARVTCNTQLIKRGDGNDGGGGSMEGIVHDGELDRKSIR